MNKENVQAALDDLKVRQDLFLISKLEKEYRELSDKCNKLYTFIYSLDFITKVPNGNERILMQEQHKRMESYRNNLYQRIDFYRDRVKTACGYDILVSWSVVAERIRQFGVPIDPAKIERTIETPCGPVHLVNHDEQHHCGQDASWQVGDGNAVVNEIPNSIKSLEGMQVIKVCGPKCKDCPCGDGLREYPSGRDMSSCVKIELVGGYTLCLAPLPNSIITE